MAIMENIVGRMMNNATQSYKNAGAREKECDPLECDGLNLPERFLLNVYMRYACSPPDSGTIVPSSAYTRAPGSIERYNTQIQSTYF